MAGKRWRTIHALDDRQSEKWTNRKWKSCSLSYSSMPRVWSTHNSYLKGNSAYYVEVLDKLSNRVVRCRNEITAAWQLHCDNAPGHTALRVREFLAKHNLSTLPQLPYSSDLSPADLFPSIKIVPKGAKSPWQRFWTRSPSTPSRMRSVHGKTGGKNVWMPKRRILWKMSKVRNDIFNNFFFFYQNPVHSLDFPSAKNNSKIRRLQIPTDRRDERFLLHTRYVVSSFRNAVHSARVALVARPWLPFRTFNTYTSSRVG